MKLRIAIFVIFNWCYMPHVTAQVYKVEKEDGTVVFTDTPAAADSKTVTFDAKTSNITPTLPGKAPAAPTPQPQKKVRYTINIASPAPEATIRNNKGKVSIVASASPKPVGRYQLTLDDKVIKQNSSGSFALSGVPRGAHTFQIQLLGNKGKTLASSKTQTFYMHQASALINQGSAQ
ncbi:DUF4124 domain-containing protein [Salinimonas marina]|uniref:DUF4124 domain-containing protein n=1 Tax=Salinimonas marina TaxID=2785918 RepID=A0A7S9HDI8_9ALTE|nr:DUF4124 domain-containing protein [Salinimonas marina]QPG06199.1 DUF4124 domain-containing protein [Salinimonas marina]